ncbi:hypothetical protein [Thalassoroseus pseudoceratinae]|uniref:hypothetical protein n=1 Tax=Thalassoroseus pseudoceratinae TaxID=2713176 RepID=UPI0014246430|nr:hypothetical protein [Thalassoroseus pseudoceratinae]
MSVFLQWFETFLEEKNLPVAHWNITASDGTEHVIDSEVVIEAIKTAPAHEQAEIKTTIVKIDSLNGDVNHFFRHLATALVENYSAA